ncbi:type II toxin-antitoxin system VapC family toxin [Synechococcus sp. CS-1325]|uniref:type II toxin-antitoxin system VapC family toxin n=1 Tax=Synechococcus sp. CS-1325 TaxID=2847979 RepID=UPI000DB341F8|nr:type II toxin-antitoxin system VapC family toxin [Synechococcus sp. CS-1325]MCT0200612.1 type II toxin-antitoxin system VapC family toxin [Synechococcus sp. CS-1325]PZV00476.1 MAG: PIN domain nuclease [Cyanobium sp.]
MEPALPLLLDTHVLLWWAVEPQRLPEPLRQELSDRRRQLLFSVVSLWEVAIKTSLNRPGFQVDAQALRQGLLREGFSEQAITADHVLAVQHLPWVHRDPFDRLLVAQARCEGLTLLSADRTLLGYGPDVRLAAL